MAHEVTNAVTDRSLLGPMAKRAKEALGVEELEVLADMGYYDGQQVKDCLEEGITPYIPKADTSANKKLGLYGKGDFRYDVGQDCYWCPAGEKLSFRFPWSVSQGNHNARGAGRIAVSRAGLTKKCSKKWKPASRTNPRR